VTAADLRELHRRVLRTSVELVSAVTPADLSRATPCAEWTLADLLAHMTVQHYGFAAAALGHGADPAVWQVQPLAADPVAAYAVAVEHVLLAFARDGVLEQPFSLPEISPALTFLGSQAIGFHFIDCVVHGWDVARSLGLGYSLEPDILAAALPLALAVPAGDRRLAPGAAFRPGLPASQTAPPLERILAALGRSSAWPA
jgi:uncharacterized protein (TIGR03086 family)